MQKPSEQTDHQEDSSKTQPRCWIDVNQVGEPWPDDIEVSETDETDEPTGPPTETNSLNRLLVLCGVIWIGSAVFGMVEDPRVLDTVLSLTQNVVVAIIGWWFGRSRLP